MKLAGCYMDNGDRLDFYLHTRLYDPYDRLDDRLDDRLGGLNDRILVQLHARIRARIGAL